MNRLICPVCDEPSYCASLAGPLHCANEECGALLLPGNEVADTEASRMLAQERADTKNTVGSRDHDPLIVERGPGQRSRR